MVFDLLESLGQPSTGNFDYSKSLICPEGFDYDIRITYTNLYLYSSLMPRVKKSKLWPKYEQIHNSNEGRRIYLRKSNLKKKRKCINDIKWTKALGDYIKLWTNEGNIVTFY